MRTEWEGTIPDPEPDACFPGLALERHGRWPCAVRFRYHHSLIGEGLRGSVALGAEATSELLPAGRFTLHARMPGGRVASAPVELVDGRTTEITLRFD
jgi:hypothetical protein